jgi:hypothetical protein
MDSTVTLAMQIVLDVLALRGPGTDNAPFRMTTGIISDRRIALAKRFKHLVPDGCTIDDVERVAAGIAPLLRT